MADPAAPRGKTLAAPGTSPAHRKAMGRFLSWPVFHSLRARLLLLVLLAILPAFGMIVYAGTEQRRLSALNARREVSQLVRLAVVQHENTVRETRHILQFLAAAPEVRMRDVRACTALLVHLLRQNPGYTNFGAVLPNGDIFCGAQTSSGTVNVSDKIYFRQALEKRGFAIGEYQIGVFTGKAITLFGYPALDVAGHLQAVVFAALDLAWLNRLATEAQWPAGFTLSLMDHAGRVLSRYPDPEKWVGTYRPPDHPLRQTISQETKGLVEAPGLDGRVRLYVTARLRGPEGLQDLYLTIGMPRDAVFAAANKLFSRYLAYLGVVALVALGAAWAGADVFVLRGVKALLAATTRLGGGDLTARSGLPHNRGELGELARAFDDMATLLEESQLETRQAIQLLRETNQSLQALIQASPLAIVAMNSQRNITIWNPAAERIFGWTAQEVLGRPLPMVPVDQREGFLELQARLRGGEALQGVEVRRQRKDGSPIDLAAYSAPLHDSQGTVVGSISILADITERRRAEARFRTVLEAAPDAMVIANHDGRIAIINSQAEHLFGYTRAELVGQPVELLMPQRFRAAHEGHRANYVADARPRPMGVGLKLVGLRKGGGEFPAEISLSPLETEEGTLVIAAIRDITVRKRAEELQRAQEAAEAANRAKSEFLSRMSHELRTPLNAILGFAQLLQLDAQTPEQREGVEHIVKGGRHLLDLINEVLDITRIEMGRLSLSPEPVPVADLLRESCDLVAPLAAGRGIRVLLEGGPPDAHVQADRQRLKQVLLNLLANAVKYNRDGGTVTVRCESLPAERVRLMVTDTGPGIPAGLLDRLFTPFDRLGAEQSGAEGTGLGLALSKRLVEAMGGTMGVESALGEGSTFWVELSLVPAPAEQPAGQPPETLPGAAATSPAATVLYIEDNLSNLRLVERVLAHRPGITLLPAMQGRLGLELAREHRPSLILLDLQLPDVPGHEVLRHLQGDPRTRDIPVIVISADATPGQLDRLRAAGARTYLTKPLDVPRLLALLDETLGR